MGPSHGGMQRSLEMMKQMARNGGKLERDRIEHLLPLVTLGLTGFVVVLVIIYRAAT